MVLLKPFKNYQKKMENNLEVQKINAQNEITARYNFLLNEQPNLKTIAPQKFITTLTGGCLSVLIPIYLDLTSDIESNETLCYMVGGFFLLGGVITHAIGQFLNDRSNKKILVNNIETLQNWTRPIIILPYNRFDPSVDARAKEITDILQDAKCLNHLDIALENAEMSFEYSINYGFRTGEKCKTNTGLPVVALFPELFILRGAFDDRLWFEFQKEAVRIALEIDNDFAKSWYALETEKYRAVAGGQLIA